MNVIKYGYSEYKDVPIIIICENTESLFKIDFYKNYEINMIDITKLKPDKTV